MDRRQPSGKPNGAPAMLPGRAGIGNQNRACNANDFAYYPGSQHHPGTIRGPSGRSSGVEHNLAKVGVEGSNPFARSNISEEDQDVEESRRMAAFLISAVSKHIAITGKHGKSPKGSKG